MKTLQRIAEGAVVPLLLLTLWQCATTFNWWPRTLIASPLGVVSDFWSLSISGELFAHARVSLTRVLAGFALGAVLAILVGSMVGFSKTAERMVAPTVQALTPIPPTAWIPILIILLGIGNLSKVALIVIGAFAVVYVNTVQGIRGADQKLVEVATTLQKPRRDLVLYVLLPSAAPSIVTGMRVALGLSWILLIAAEMIAAKMVSASSRVEGLGLGWLIQDARNFSRPDDMIVGMITIGILGKLSDMLMAYLEKRLFIWRQAFEGV